MSTLAPHERRIGLIVALGGLVTVLDTTIVAVAIPDLLRAFDATIGGIQWVAIAYTLGLVATMLLAASAGVRWGTRRVYIGALIGFAATSALAGLSTNLAQLIAARAGQGMAGGLIAPLGMAIASGAVAPERRGRMIALTGIPLLVGPILGPVAGGLLLDAGSWRSIFFVTVPPALLGAIAAARLLPPTPPAPSRDPVDIAGALMLVPGVGLVALGIGAETLGAPSRVFVAAVGAVLTTTFVRRSATQANPLLRVRLLRDPTFGRNAAILAAFAAPYFGSIVLMPTYIQILRMSGAFDTALLMIPGAVGMGISLQVAARVLERFGPRAVVGTGLFISIAQVLVSSLVLRPDTSFAVIALLGAVQGLGTGAVMMPSMASAARNLHGADLASGASILPLVTTLANGLGTVVVSSLFAALADWKMSGVALVDLHLLAPAARATAVAGAVDAIRTTQAISVVLMLLALLLRLRSGGAPARDSIDEMAEEVPVP